MMRVRRCICSGSSRLRRGEKRTCDVEERGRRANALERVRMDTYCMRRGFT